MATSFFIHSYSSKAECNTTDGELNNKISPPLSLLLSNSITRTLSNEIQVNCTIKGRPLWDIGLLESSCTFLLLVDVIHLSKWERLRWGFLWEPCKRVYQLTIKFEPLILPFDDPNKSLIKNVHLQTLKRLWFG